MLFDPPRSEENEKNNRRARMLFGKTTPRWGGRYTWLNEEPDAVQDHFARMPPGSIPRKRPEGFDPVQIASLNLNGAVTQVNPGIDPAQFSRPGMLGNGFLGMPPSQPTPLSPESEKPDEQQPKHRPMPYHPEKDTSHARPLPYYPEKDRSEKTPYVLRGDDPGADSGSDPDIQLFNSNQTHTGATIPGVGNPQPTRTAQFATMDENTDQPPSAQDEEREKGDGNAETNGAASTTEESSNTRMGTLDILRYASGNFELTEEDGSAADVLRRLKAIGEQNRWNNATTALDHFLNGSGKDLVLTGEEARQRGPVQDGEASNQRNFEQRIALDRSGKTRNPPDGRLRTRLESQGKLKVPPSPYNYYSDLINLQDGQSTQLKVKPTIKDPNPQPDYYKSDQGYLDHIGSGGMDEILATGRSSVISTAENGLSAKRSGDLVKVEGVITHQWNDVYDFADGPFSDLAKQAIEDGDAQVYKMQSQWQQKMTLTYRREGDRFILESSDWQDLENPAEHQENPN